HAAAPVHGDAGRPHRAPRFAADAAADVARARGSARGANVVSRPDGAGDRRPPPLAVWILGRVLPRGPRGDTVLGDLVEEWQAHGATAAATLRFWRQTVSVAVRYRWRREHVNEPAPAGERNTRMSLDNLVQDVRYAVRSYVKAPSFALTILFTLALGIGASTAIFSM